MMLIPVFLVLACIVFVISTSDLTRYQRQLAAGAVFGILWLCGTLLEVQDAWWRFALWLIVGTAVIYGCWLLAVGPKREDA